MAHNKRERFKPPQSIDDKDYQFALFFQESAKKIEIVKQVQSIVINSERLVCSQGRKEGFWKSEKKGGREGGREGLEGGSGDRGEVRGGEGGWD